jgi:hypothetical protein
MALAAKRVCIRLDPAMLIEGVLLRRLAQIPKARRQEWLRGLLVQGCLWEVRTSREAGGAGDAAGYVQGPNASPPNPPRPSAPWLVKPQPPRPQAVAQDSMETPTTPTAPKAPTPAKPFAHLRKVIG